MGGVRLAAKIEEGLMLRFTKRVDYGDGDAVRRRPPGRGANRGHADRRRVQHPQRAPRQDPAAPGEAAPDRSDPKGGYRLASKPEELTVGQVVRALEGPIAIATST